MQINLKFLDCVQYIASMLVEIPAFAENKFLMNKQVVSKNFKNLIDFYDQKAFHLAAEDYRDNIVFAAHALNKGNWKGAIENIFNITFLKKLTLFQSGELKTMLTNAFKDAAFKVYIFSAVRQYSSFSITSLAEMFQLE